MTEETTTPETESTTAVASKNTPSGDTSAQKKEESRPAQRSRSPRRGGGRQRKPREPKEFEESILDIARVTRVVKGGRRMRFRITVVIGDKKGRVGIGTGKSSEVLGGIQKAVACAKKNLVNVSIFDGTIPHEVSAKFKASKVMILPAQEGKGIIAGGAVRKILELAGYKNVLSKAHGSRNTLNLSFATFEALGKLQKVAVAPKKQISEEKSEEKLKEKIKEPKTSVVTKTPAKKEEKKDTK